MSSRSTASHFTKRFVGILKRAIHPGSARSRSPGEPQAFRIVEFFQLICANLDFHDLVHCTQVCRHWRAKVISSKPLRRLVFLEPVPQQDPLEPGGILPEDSPYINPLFVRMLRKCSKYNVERAQMAFLLTRCVWKDALAFSPQNNGSVLMVGTLHWLPNYYHPNRRQCSCAMHPILLRTADFPEGICIKDVFEAAEAQEGRVWCPRIRDQQVHDRVLIAEPLIVDFRES